MLYHKDFNIFDEHNLLTTIKYPKCSLKERVFIKLYHYHFHFNSFDDDDYFATILRVETLRTVKKYRCVSFASQKATETCRVMLELMILSMLF